MGWAVELHLDRDDYSPEELGQVLQEALPGLEWGPAPTGPERLAAMRDLGIEVPDAVRVVHEQRTERTYGATVETDEGSLELGLDAGPVLYCEGRGNPLPLLRQLCEATGWWVADAAAPDTPLDLTGTPAAYARFQEFAAQALEHARSNAED